MSYYYDIILNWSENDAYNFYEWNDTDYLELVKKIPIFKIKHKAFLDISVNNVKVNEEFLDLIKDRTLISGKNIINKINYAALFTDGKNVLAVEFNSKGISTNRSKLLIDDELNVLEVAYSLKESLFIYDVLENIKINKVLRQEEEATRIIFLEINNLYKSKKIAKLRYLYYEYKKEKLEDIEIIYQNIIDDLKNGINQDILKLYYIIKLSYHNV